MFSPASGLHSAPAAVDASQPPADASRPRVNSGDPQRSVADGQALAEMSERFLAVVVDMLVIGAAFAVIGMWGARRWGGVTVSGFNLTGTPALIVIALTALVGFVYYWIAEGVWGVTLGKAIAGIRVRSAAGGRAHLRASLIRNVSRVIDGIAVYLVGFLIAICSKRRQRLGDRLADTVVVRSGGGRTERIAGAVILVAIIAGAGFGAGALHRAASQAAVADATRLVMSEERGAGTPREPVLVATPASSNEASSNETTPAEPSNMAVAASSTTSGTMKLASFAWLRSAHGVPREAAPYRPGDDLYATYQLTGAATDTRGRIDVCLRLVVLDPGGIPLGEPWTHEIRGSNAGGQPINGNFHLPLPAYAPPGIYTVTIEAHDAVANADARFARTFTVDAPAEPPAHELEARGFRFSTSRDGPSFSPAVYRGGRTVYSAFRVAGLQFRDDEIDMHVDFTLIGPAGETVLEKPDWMTARERFAYHPPSFSIPVRVHVGLPHDAPKGTYREEFTVRDGIANTSVTHRATFEVR